MFASMELYLRLPSNHTSPQIIPIAKFGRSKFRRKSSSPNVESFSSFPLKQSCRIFPITDEQFNQIQNNFCFIYFLINAIFVTNADFVLQYQQVGLIIFYKFNKYYHKNYMKPRQPQLSPTTKNTDEITNSEYSELSLKWATHVQFNQSQTSRQDHICNLIKTNCRYFSCCLVYARDRKQAQAYKKLIEVQTKISAACTKIKDLSDTIKANTQIKVYVSFFENGSIDKNYNVPTGVDFIINLGVLISSQDYQRIVRKSIRQCEKLGVVVNFCSSAQQKQVVSEFLSKSKVKTIRFQQLVQQKLYLQAYFKEINIPVQDLTKQKTKIIDNKVIRRENHQDNLKWATYIQYFCQQEKMGLLNFLRIGEKKTKFQVVNNLLSKNLQYFHLCVIYIRDLFSMRKLRYAFSENLENITDFRSLDAKKNQKHRIFVVESSTKIDQIINQVDFVIFLDAISQKAQFQKKISKKSSNQGLIFEGVVINIIDSSQKQIGQNFTKITKEHQLRTAILQVENFNLSQYFKIIKSTSKQKIQPNQEAETTKETTSKSTKLQQLKINLQWATHLIINTEQQYKAGRCMNYINKNYTKFDKCIVYVKNESRGKFIMDRLSPQIKVAAAIIVNYPQNYDQYLQKLEKGQLKTLIIVSTKQNAEFQAFQFVVPHSIDLIITDAMPASLELYKRRIAKAGDSWQCGVVINMLSSVEEIQTMKKFCIQNAINLNEQHRKDDYELVKYLKKKIIPAQQSTMKKQQAIVISLQSSPKRIMQFNNSVAEKTVSQKDQSSSLSNSGKIQLIPPSSQKPKQQAIKKEENTDILQKKLIQNPKQFEKKSNDCIGNPNPAKSEQSKQHLKIKPIQMANNSKQNKNQQSKQIQLEQKSIQPNLKIKQQFILEAGLKTTIDNTDISPIIQEQEKAALEFVSRIESKAEKNVNTVIQTVRQFEKNVNILLQEVTQQNKLNTQTTLNIITNIEIMAKHLKNINAEIQSQNTDCIGVCHNKLKIGACIRVRWEISENGAFVNLNENS